MLAAAELLLLAVRLLVVLVVYLVAVVPRISPAIQVQMQLAGLAERLPVVAGQSTLARPNRALVAPVASERVAVVRERTALPRQQVGLAAMDTPGSCGRGARRPAWRAESVGNRSSLSSVF
jgi:hypothetical protein